MYGKVQMAFRWACIEYNERWMRFLPYLLPVFTSFNISRWHWAPKYRCILEKVHLQSIAWIGYHLGIIPSLRFLQQMKNHNNLFIFDRKTNAAFHWDYTVSMTYMERILVNSAFYNLLILDLTLYRGQGIGKILLDISSVPCLATPMYPHWSLGMVLSLMRMVIMVCKWVFSFYILVTDVWDDVHIFVTLS